MNITEHIVNNGLSRSQICAKAKISRTMLSLIESGKRQIGPDRAQDFADALGVPVESVRPDLAKLFSYPNPLDPSQS
ncbi:helix-turn-helix transcriptional regulator [Paracoccus sp. PAR01]|uniref:helix-turn-helix domain-containing protein n=1 Tax=Paracoccus sp. PAR01 TaxID=2769282 RepID=UPI0017849CE9|nr:helix-turn-helix transcriptional regulator [Paracoccus sp. PAR01]MBD9528405.1 helix-turn-helix domain-containing protein [Paracoccus sp. PAR01]